MIFRKSKTYNLNFVNSYSETENNVKETRLYFLTLGVLFPITEIFTELFNVRVNSELMTNLILGGIFLIGYFLSRTNNFFIKHITFIFSAFFLAFTAFTLYKTVFLPFDLITFSELLIVLFFSYAIFRSIKHFYVFIATIVVLFIVLAFIHLMPVKLSLIYLNAIAIIFVLNYVRHLAILNSKEKLLFSNNIVHNGSSLILATNKFGEVLFCSDNIVKILGYKPVEVMGMEFWNLTQDKEFELIDYSGKYVQDKIYVRKLKCKNGSYRYIQWLDNRYSSNLYVGIGQDVTEQMIIQEQYKNIVQNAVDIIYETDGSGNFIFMNEATTTILGYTPQELLGKHFTSVVKEDYKVKVTKFYAKDEPHTNHFEILEFPIIGKGGKEFWVSQKVNLKRDGSGKIINYTAIVRDITALKQIEFQHKRKQGKINNYNSILNKLTTNPNFYTHPFNEILSTILTEAMNGLAVDRISAWNHLEGKIVCAKAINSKNGSANEGEVLLQTNYPLYFNAIGSGTTVIAHHICENEHTKEFCLSKENDIKSLLDVPIFNNGELTGLICCEMTDSFKTWDTEDVSFVRSISEIISISIETRKRKKAEKQLAFRAEILAAVAKITESLLISRNIQETLNDHFNLLGEVTRVDKVYFYENNIETNTVSLKNAWYSNDDLMQKDKENLKDHPIDSFGTISQCLLANKPFFSLTKNSDNPYLKQRFVECHILSTLILPISIKEVVYGFIGFDDCKIEKLWADDQLNVLQSLANNIAYTIERKIAEHTIKESESNFRLLNETIDDVFWLYDLEAKKILYISHSSEKHLGISPEDFYKTDNYWVNYILDEDKSLILEAHREIEINGFYEIEYRIHTKEGIKWIHEKSFGIKGDTGKYIKSSGICTDITEKKKIEIQLKQLSIVAEKTSNGVLIADKNGSTIWANQGYLQMFEIELPHLIGKRPRDLFNPNDEKLSAEIDSVNGKNYTKEIEVTTFLKKKKWIEVNSTVILDDKNNVTQQIEVVTDITEKVKHKNILLQYSTDLEYQSVLQQKIINSLSYEELAIETLGFIQKQMKGCNRISLLSLDDKNTVLSGHLLVEDKLTKIRLPANETSSFNTLLKGNKYIEKDLRTVEHKTADDLEQLSCNVISYIVLPIFNKSQLIGSLNICLDHEFDVMENEIKNLESFTVLLSVALQQISLKNELYEKNRDTIDSLSYAQNIQNTILPEIRNTTNTFKDVCLYFKPRDIVSGDFYWAKELNDLSFIVIADCTGHGVPGAFLTLIGSRILEQIVNIEKITDPAEILTKLDEQIYVSLNSKTNDLMRDGMEIGFCAIDRKNQKIRFAGAGLGLLYFVNDEEYYIKGQRKSIGDYRHEDFQFKTVEIDYTGEEVFYMATDGYQDQLGGANYKRFSKKRTMDLLRNLTKKSGQEKELLLAKEMEDFMGNYQQTDDMTVISFRVKTN